MKLTVGVEIFFNFSKSECQFPHPVDAAAHAAGGEVDLGGGGVGAEPVRVEVVARQILAVIITGHIVNMNLGSIEHQSDQFQNIFIKFDYSNSVDIKLQITISIKADNALFGEDLQRLV